MKNRRRCARAASCSVIGRKMVLATFRDRSRHQLQDRSAKDPRHAPPAPASRSTTVFGELGRVRRQPQPPVPARHCLPPGQSPQSARLSDPYLERPSSAQDQPASSPASPAQRVALNLRKSRSAESRPAHQPSVATAACTSASQQTGSARQRNAQDRHPRQHRRPPMHAEAGAPRAPARVASSPAAPTARRKKARSRKISQTAPACQLPSTTPCVPVRWSRPARDEPLRAVARQRSPATKTKMPKKSPVTSSQSTPESRAAGSHTARPKRRPPSASPRRPSLFWLGDGGVGELCSLEAAATRSSAGRSTCGADPADSRARAGRGRRGMRSRTRCGSRLGHAARVRCRCSLRGAHQRLRGMPRPNPENPPLAARYPSPKFMRHRPLAPTHTHGRKRYRLAPAWHHKLQQGSFHRAKEVVCCLPEHLQPLLKKDMAQ